MLPRLAKHPLRISLLASVLVLALSAPLPAQDPDAEEEMTFGSEVSVGYVFVPVVVRNKSGFAKDLDQRQFRLFVDQQPVAIESFERGATAPIGILFLQDLSGSMGVAPKMRQARQLIDCIRRSEQAGDEFAAASFSDEQLFVDVPFPGDSDALDEAIASWRGYGKTALHDAIAWLPDLVSARSSPRRAVVLITDGVDNASETSATSAREEVRQAEVPVHVVGFETGSPYTLDAAGKKLYPQSDVLNLVGWATGGGYHPIRGEADLGRACASIVDDLRHQYVLGFSTRGEDLAKPHNIRVSLPSKSKKLQIRHRHSYEGTSPLTMAPQP